MSTPGDMTSPSWRLWYAMHAADIPAAEAADLMPGNASGREMLLLARIATLAALFRQDAEEARGRCA